MSELEISDHVSMHLGNAYDILYLEKIKYFFESPINQIYQKLIKVKRECYNNNHRIVLIDNLAPDKNKQYFYNHLQKILTHLDITNCFVMVVTSDSDVVDYLDVARKTYSQDQTHMQIEQMSLPNESVATPTNYNIPDTVCVNPWIGLYIDVEGKISPCCRYQLESTESILHQSLLTVINSTNQIRLKKEFLHGTRPQGCSSCWEDEDHGKVSKRLHANYVFREKLFDIDFNNINSSQLFSLHVSLKNTCNLSCRICNPTCSSKWFGEISQHLDMYPQWKSLKNIKLEWTDQTDSNLWKDIRKIGQQIQYVSFAGGEPLLDKTHVDILKYFIDNNRSSQISLHYNTNGTIYADHLIPLWNKFKCVELSFSLDNVESKFEYERYGATWNVVVNNISKYQKLDPAIYAFNVYSTITALNILDSYDVFQFCENNQLPVVFNLLDNPQELNVALFNNKQKNYISTKLLKIGNTKFNDLINPIVDAMKKRKTQCNVTDMINYLNVTDQIRRQDFKKNYQELSNLLNLEEI
jgi:MoaA/NifB/PqqE/SkfB family radical SAM enzyme